MTLAEFLTRLRDRGGNVDVLKFDYIVKDLEKHILLSKPFRDQGKFYRNRGTLFGFDKNSRLGLTKVESIYRREGSIFIQLRDGI